MQARGAPVYLYGSEGWGFESLRARTSERAQVTGPYPLRGGVFSCWQERNEVHPSNPHSGALEAKCSP